MSRIPFTGPELLLELSMSPCEVMRECGIVGSMGVRRRRVQVTSPLREAEHDFSGKEVCTYVDVGSLSDLRAGCRSWRRWSRRRCS